MATTTKNKNEITITRIFDAPREVVWKAWTDPEEVIKWWGPKGFTSPVFKIDLRGGRRVSQLHAITRRQGLLEQRHLS